MFFNNITFAGTEQATQSSLILSVGITYCCIRPCTVRTVHTLECVQSGCCCLSAAWCESERGVAAFVSVVSKVKNCWKLTLSLLSTLDKMKENDPLIILTHTMIENSAPRPQLYQQVRPVRLRSTSSPPAVCCALLLLLLRRLRPHRLPALPSSAPNCSSSIASDCYCAKSCKYGNDFTKKSSMKCVWHFVDV